MCLKKHFVFAHNFDTGQPIFIIFGRQEFAERINPSNAFCVTALLRKILTTILVMFFTAESVTVLFWEYLCQFYSNFTISERMIHGDYYLQLYTSFVLADVGNQLKVGNNAMEPDDVSM